MHLLQKLHQQGFKVILVDDDHIGVTPKDKITPDLARKIREQKPLLIEMLRTQTEADEYARGTARKYKGKGRSKSGTSDTSQEPKYSRAHKRYCEGYQPLRYVHPDVCKWHLENADPKCMHCKHLGHRDREFWMNAYLDKAIARLNAYYEPGNKIDWDRQVARQRIDQVEEKITQAFLTHDIELYKEMVNKWEQTFKEVMRKP